MRLILFVENLDSPSLQDDPLVQQKIVEFFEAFGEFKEIDFYGSKYLVGLFKMHSRDINKLDATFRTENIHVACRYFLEFRQFKRFLINLEKKFLHFNTQEDPSDILTTILPLIRESKGSVLYRVEQKSYATEDMPKDPSLTYYQVVLELEQKKNGFTSSKLHEFNQELEGKIFLQKIKVLAPMLSKYKDRLAPKQHWDFYTKPNTKLYHHLLKADQAKLIDLSANYCFRIDYDKDLEL